MSSLSSKPAHATSFIAVSRKGHAFTLLEAVLALAILGASIGVCLQLRASVGVASAQVERRMRVDQETEALFQCVINGLLEKPSYDKQTESIVWIGKQHGVPFRVERQEIAAPNPSFGKVDHEVAATVGVFRYRITLGKSTTELLWHR